MNHQPQCFAGLDTDFFFGQMEVFHQPIYIRYRAGVVRADAIELPQDSFFHFGGGLVGEGHGQDVPIGVWVAYQMLDVFHGQRKGLSGAGGCFVDG